MPATTRPRTTRRTPPVRTVSDDPTVALVRVATNHGTPLVRVHRKPDVAPITGAFGPQWPEEERGYQGRELFYDLPWEAFFSSLGPGNDLARWYGEHRELGSPERSVVVGSLRTAPHGYYNVTPTPALHAWIASNLIHVTCDRISFQLVTRKDKAGGPPDHLLLVRYDQIIGDRYLRIFRDEELPPDLRTYLRERNPELYPLPR